MKHIFLRSIWRYSGGKRLHATTAKSIQYHPTRDSFWQTTPFYFKVQLNNSRPKWEASSDGDTKFSECNATRRLTNSICNSIFGVVLQKCRLTIYRNTAVNALVFELQYRVYSGLFYHDQNVQSLKNRLLRCYFKPQLLFIGAIGSIVVSFKLALLQSLSVLEATAYWMWMQQIPPELHDRTTLSGWCGIQVQNVQQSPIMVEIKISNLLELP